MHTLAALALCATPGICWLLYRLPDLAALRDHEARARAFLHGFNVGRA